jgi:hydroxyacylglutathione hydrolase
MTYVKPIPALSDNYIWALVSGRDAIAFDAGEAAPLKAFLFENNLRLVALFSTHHHDDHVGGNVEIAQRFQMPVVAPAGIPAATNAVKGGESIALELDGGAGVAIDVIATPGHPLDSVSYVARLASGATWLFSGDTLFSGGCGRIFEGTAEMMWKSLERFSDLPDDAMLCCGHEYTLTNLRFGETVEPDNAAIAARLAIAEKLRAEGKPTLPSTMKEERETNVFLRAGTAERFAEIRKRKDGVA